MRPPRIVRRPSLVASRMTKPMMMPARAATRRRRSRPIVKNPVPSLHEDNPVRIAIRHRPSRPIELRHRWRYGRQIRAVNVKAGEDLRIGAAAVLQPNLLENQRRAVRVLPSIEVHAALRQCPDNLYNRYD